MRNIWLPKTDLWHLEEFYEFLNVLFFTKTKSWDQTNDYEWQGKGVFSEATNINTYIMYNQKSK